MQHTKPKKIEYLARETKLNLFMMPRSRRYVGHKTCKNCARVCFECAASSHQKLLILKHRLYHRYE